MSIYRGDLSLHDSLKQEAHKRGLEGGETHVERRLIDALAERLQQAKRHKDQAELKRELLVHSNGFIFGVTRRFYIEHWRLLERQSVSLGDLHSKAVEVVLAKFFKWHPRKQRLAEGKQPASFTTYMYLWIWNGLQREFVQPALRNKRQAWVESLSDYGTSDQEDYRGQADVPDEDNEQFDAREKYLDGGRCLQLLLQPPFDPLDSRY